MSKDLYAEVVQEPVAALEQQDMSAFAEECRKASQDGQEVFEFNGQQYVTRYALHIIGYNK